MENGKARKNVKGKPKYCANISEGLKISSWLQGDTANDMAVVKESIRIFKAHLDHYPPQEKKFENDHSEQSSCACIAKGSNNLILAVNYYHLFFLKLERFSQKVEEEEDKLAQENEGSDKLNGFDPSGEDGPELPISSQLPNPDAFKPSRYDSHVLPHLDNPKVMQQEILEPLKRSVHYLRNAFYPKTESGSIHHIPTKLLEGLRVNTLLVTCHNIFNCYGLPEYRYQCARLLIKLADEILGPEERESLLIAYYLMIRLYLDYKCIKKADEYLGRAKILLTRMKLKPFEGIPETYEAALIYIVKWEIDLRRGNFEKSAQQLREFIDSNYLKKVTLNRFYLKGLALVLASKFPSAFPFSSNYAEFVEPLHIVLNILKRWHRPLLAPPKPESNGKASIIAVEDDHTWYKYEIYAFAMKILPLIKTFYFNIGFPMELSPVYNCLLTLARRNCFVFWSLKLLLIGASIDSLCDKKKSAIHKLENALSALTGSHDKLNFASKVELGTNGDHQGAISPLKLNTKLVNTLSDMDVELVGNINDHYHNFTNNSAPDNCVHDRPLSILEIERILRCHGSKSDVEDDLMETPFASKLASLVEDRPYPTNLYLLEALIDLSFAEEKVDEVLTTQMKEIALSFTSNSAIISQKLVKSLNIDGRSFNLDCLDEIMLFKLKVINMLADRYASNGEHDMVISLADAIIPQLHPPFFDFTLHDMVGRLVLKVVRARLHKLNLKPSFVQFDAREIEEKMVKPLNVCRTPSPPRAKTQGLSHAPKREPKYKMEELREYAKGLHQPSSEAAPKSKVPVTRESSRTTKNSSSVSENLNQGSVLEKSSRKPSTSSRRSTRSSSTRSSHSSAAKKKNSSSTEPILDAPTERRSKTCGIESLTKAIECITIEDDSHDDADDIEVFEMSHQDMLEDVQKQGSIHRCASILRNLLSYYGNHPPTEVYSSIHQMLFEINSSTESSNPTAALYHLSESSNSTMIRYRALFACENKKRLKIPMTLNLESLGFNPARDLDRGQLEKMSKSLPNNWRIVQIFYSKSAQVNAIPDLIVSRFQRNRKPIIFKIRGNPNKFTRDFMEEFYEIIELSNASIRKQDSRTFWKARDALDKRLAGLLHSVGETWFGPFKGIFMGDISHSTKQYKEFCAKLKKTISTFFDACSCSADNFLDLVVESFFILTKQQFESAICLLFSQSSFSILEECYHQCLEVYDQFYKDQSKEEIFEKLNFGPVGLIVNKPLDGFPFESIPSSVSIKQQFFRIPSIRFLSVLLETHLPKNNCYTNGVNPKEAYYLLNPSNNLMKTEKRFKEKFLNQKTWKGVIGQPPDWKDLKQSLESKDLYIFFGHGAGSTYYKLVPDGIDSLSLRPASLVVGCCSGKLFSDGNGFDSFGMPHRFMLNGCPTYLGLLWDVTDGDIDKFADRLLSLWIHDWKSDYNDAGEEEKSIKHAALCKALVNSRSACRFPCLTGAAPVVYGLPILLAGEN